MKTKLLKNPNSKFLIFLLHLFVPGLGHIYIKEYLFGIFIFLITLTASVLFTISLFISIPLFGRILMYGLPLLFYLFSFFDLHKTIESNSNNKLPSQKKLIIFFVIGFIFQISWPLAPINFGIKNCPDIFIQKDNSLEPFFRKDDLLKASQLEYFLDIWFLEQPVLHSLPDRFEIVKFKTEDQKEICGFVLGLPSENVEMVEGVLVVNNSPVFIPNSLNLYGDNPLISIESYSILVVTVHLGYIDQTYDVPIMQLVGKVEKLF